MYTRFFLLGIGALCACSSSDGHTGSNPNMTNTGGSSAGSGGLAVSTGGSTAGGTTGSAGAGGSTVSGNGGIAPSGNGGTAVGNGGSNTAGSGGSMIGNGGALGGAGGTVGTGGAAGMVAAGGQAGGGSGQPSRSAGCGMTAPMAGSLTIDVMGTSRQYILALPANYDPSMAYRLVFAWHGLGGSAQQVASNWYGMKTLSQNSAIFVAGQGLMTSTSVGDGAGWANTNGQDVNFVKALYAKLQAELCFDQNKVFSVGMSYGGIMSDTLGCQMGDVFRAIAPMSGAGPGYGGGRGPTCTGPVAVWMSNGDNDTVVPTASERSSRDFWVAANHCQMASMPVDPSPCVAYQGCDAGYPVTWCEFAGGHTIPPFAASAIWKFFSQF